MIEKQCLECGESFYCKSSAKLTCSNSCKRARQARLRKVVKCKNCNKPFKATAHRPVFCCSQCKTLYNIRVFGNDVLNHCVFCGVAIPPRRKFCSTVCKNAFFNDKSRQARVIREEIKKLYDEFSGLHYPLLKGNRSKCAECGRAWPCRTIQMFESWVNIS